MRHPQRDASVLSLSRSCNQAFAQFPPSKPMAWPTPTLSTIFKRGVFVFFVELSRTSMAVVVSLHTISFALVRAGTGKVRRISLGVCVQGGIMGVATS